MRKLKYSWELPDGSHQDHEEIAFPEAEALLRAMEPPPAIPGETGEPPFLLFWDQGDSFFMAVPDPAGIQVSAKVQDKWNILGMITGDRSFTLEFGVLSPEDTSVLLKLFFEDNYPALRALEKGMA